LNRAGLQEPSGWNKRGARRCDLRAPFFMAVHGFCAPGAGGKPSLDMRSGPRTVLSP